MSGRGLFGRAKRPEKEEPGVEPAVQLLGEVAAGFYGGDQGPAVDPAGGAAPPPPPAPPTWPDPATPLGEGFDMDILSAGTNHGRGSDYRSALGGTPDEAFDAPAFAPPPAAAPAFAPPAPAAASAHDDSSLLPFDRNAFEMAFGFDEPTFPSEPITDPFAADPFADPFAAPAAPAHVDVPATVAAADGALTISTASGPQTFENLEASLASWDFFGSAGETPPPPPPPSPASFVDFSDVPAAAPPLPASTSSAFPPAAPSLPSSGRLPRLPADEAGQVDHGAYALFADDGPTVEPSPFDAFTPPATAPPYEPLPVSEPAPFAPLAPLADPTPSLDPAPVGLASEVAVSAFADPDPIAPDAAAGDDTSEVLERLTRGLDFVITTEQVFRLASRTLDQMVPDNDVELLLRDEDGTLAQRLVGGPTGEGPRCPVPDAQSCPAIRLQRRLRFDSSEFLDACPHLSDRGGEPCAAVCIPFRTADDLAGVLHATSTVDEPLDDRTVGDISRAMDLIGLRLDELTPKPEPEPAPVEEPAEAVAVAVADEPAAPFAAAPVETVAASEPEPAPAPFDVQPLDAPAAPHVAVVGVGATDSWNGSAPAEAARALDVDSEAARIEQELHALIEAGTPFAVAIARVDHYGSFSEQHGAELGRVVLASFRRAASDVLRPDDSVVGDGAGEFFLVFPGVTAHDAAFAAERIRTRFSGSLADGGLPQATVSIGIADSGYGSDLDGLLDVAQQAVGQAEARGRDRVVAATRVTPPADAQS